MELTLRVGFAIKMYLYALLTLSHSLSVGSLEVVSKQLENKLAEMNVELDRLDSPSRGYL